MADQTEPREIPWNILPIAEGMFAGDNSLTFLRENGWPMWTGALICKIEGKSNPQADQIVDDGGLQVDGRVVKGAIEYIKEGALITIEGSRHYRIGHPGPDDYGGKF